MFPLARRAGLVLGACPPEPCRSRTLRRFKGVSRGARYSTPARDVVRMNRQRILALLLPAATPSASADVLDLVLAESRREAAVEIEPAPGSDFGHEGSVSWWIGGTAAAELGITHLAFARGGVDWFVATDFSIGLQADLGWAATEGKDGGLLLGVAPILRWHFLHRECWTLFAELGVGAAWTTVEIPEGGTRFNFTPQAGLGVTWTIDDDWRLRAALGWYHMSNARTGNNNPGLDAVAITIGIGRSF